MKAHFWILNVAPQTDSATTWRVASATPIFTFDLVPLPAS